jgi:hypothetical protein
MRLPRFSIGGLMALTALMALDCLATRALWGADGPGTAVLYFGGLPWINVLVIGLPILWGRWRRGEPIAFLAGFQVVGWAILLLDAVLAIAFPSGCEAVLDTLAPPLNSLAGRMFPAGLVAAFGAFMAILTLPQLVVALVAGALNGRHRGRTRRERAGIAR